ncbi:MAG: hypothetical protein ACLU38_12270 [Dysosmobacter sp.]
MEAHAEKGEETLQAAITVDEGRQLLRRGGSGPL